MNICIFSLFAVPLLVGCFTILWFWFTRFRKKEKIFISADCWLSVFELLPPRQLGLGIALISHRFEYYVDEHFKYRRWSLGFVKISRKEETNGTLEMEMFNDREESVEFPQKSMPKKVIGFKCLVIRYIDHNVIEFLHHFSSGFARCGSNLIMQIKNDRHLKCVLLNIWPLLKDNIRGIILYAGNLRRLRCFGCSSILSDCPSLRFVFSYRDVFPELPPEDSADATDGQAITKWLFSPRPDGVPKVLKCCVGLNEDKWPSQINGLKAAFSSASSRVNFIFVICNSPDYGFVVPLHSTNALTGEQLTLKSANNNDFLLIRCPISRDENKWTNWEKEAIELNFKDRWNTIHIAINEEEIGDGLIDGTSDPIDQRK